MVELGRLAVLGVVAVVAIIVACWAAIYLVLTAMAWWAGLRVRRLLRLLAELEDDAVP